MKQFVPNGVRRYRNPVLQNKTLHFPWQLGNRGMGPSRILGELESRQKILLLALALVAFLLGAGICHAFYTHTLATRAEIARLEQHNLALENERIQLISERAQLASRERISKISGVRFQLFEPEEKQVRRL